MGKLNDTQIKPRHNKLLANFCERPTNCMSFPNDCTCSRHVGWAILLQFSTKINDFELLLGLSVLLLIKIQNNGGRVNDAISTPSKRDIAAMKTLKTLILSYYLCIFRSENIFSIQQWKILKCRFAKRRIFVCCINFFLTKQCSIQKFRAKSSKYGSHSLLSFRWY